MFITSFILFELFNINFSDNFGKSTLSLILVGIVVIWAFLSFYTVKPEEKSIELFFGEYYDTGESGLNFAPWPLITHEVLTVTRENTEDIGVGGRGGRQDEGCLLYTSPTPRDRKK